MEARDYRLLGRKIYMFERKYLQNILNYKAILQELNPFQQSDLKVFSAVVPYNFMKLSLWRFRDY